MLLAFAKKLRTNVPQGERSADLPVGTLTVIEAYPQLRFGEIEGYALGLGHSGNQQDYK